MRCCFFCRNLQHHQVQTSYQYSEKFKPHINIPKLQTRVNEHPPSLELNKESCATYLFWLLSATTGSSLVLSAAEWSLARCSRRISSGENALQASMSRGPIDALTDWLAERKLAMAVSRPLAADWTENGATRCWRHHWPIAATLWQRRMIN